MAAHNFEDIERHVGHAVVAVTYGKPAVNAAVECADCGEVLLDFDREAYDPDSTVNARG